MLPENYVSTDPSIEISPSPVDVARVVIKVEVATLEALLRIKQSGGKSSVEETLEETTINEGIENSRSSMDVASIVEVEEVKAFEAPLNVDLVSEEIVEVTATNQGFEISSNSMDVANIEEVEAFEAPQDVGQSTEYSNLVLQESNESSLGGQGGKLEHPFVLDYNGLEEKAGLIELTRITGVHFANVVDCSQIEPSIFADLHMGLAKPSITVYTTTSSIAINWCFPDHEPKTMFKMETKLHIAMGWTLVYYGKATSFTMTGLPSGIDVGVRIWVINQGISKWSCKALYSTLPGPPEAPLALAALNIGSSEIELGWHPPVHDGGSFISGFRLEMEMPQSAWREDVSATENLFNLEQKFVTVFCGNSTRFVAGGLEPGVTYCFRVQALNMLGASPYSESIVLETRSAPPTIPEPPVVVEKTSKSISLSWPFPPCNGASVESFTLQVLVLGYGNKSLPTYDESDASNHIDLQGENLTNSANQRGHSDSCSSISNGVRYSPLQSTSSYSSRGTSEDDHEHGMEFERCVDRPQGSAICDVYCGPSNDFIVKKLQPFSSYAFRVQAQNVAGSSGFSAFSTCMTSAASPNPPPPPTVVEKNSSSLTLNWEVPEQDNGSPVFRYTLEMQKVEFNTQTSVLSRNRETLHGGKKLGKKKLGKQDAEVHLSTRVWVVVYEGHGLRSQVSGLSPGNEYSFRVKALNALGTSPPSSVLVARTLPAAPGAPEQPTFSKVTRTSVQIKWSSPACDNGMPVTSYKLMLDDGQGGQLRKVYEGEAKSYTASKLVPSSSYRAAVQAINARGASELSEVAVVELPVEMPIELPVAPPPTPSPATVVDDLPCEERPVPATVATAATKNERSAPRESIKSRKEVKQLLRQKAQQPWSQKVSRLIMQSTRQIQQPWSLWAKWICVGAVFATVFAIMHKMLM